MSEPYTITRTKLILSENLLISLLTSYDVVLRKSANVGQCRTIPP